MNLTVVILASFIPLLFGAIWYHPKFIGKYLHQPAHVHSSKVYILAFIFSLMYAFMMQNHSIHQISFKGMFHNEVGFDKEEGTAYNDYKYIMDKYKNNHRKFSHGFVHGLFLSIFTIFPILAIHFLFESKSWKYIFIHWGYWALSSAIMGGLICHFP